MVLRQPPRLQLQHTSAVTGLDVDTPFRIENVNSDYNGDFVVTEKVSSTQIKYTVQNAPSDALPTVSGSSLALVSDTVTSASPYIFNISLRSVYGHVWLCLLMVQTANWI